MKLQLSKNLCDMDDPPACQYCGAMTGACSASEIDTAAVERACIAGALADSPDYPWHEYPETDKEKCRALVRAALLASGYPQKVAELERKLECGHPAELAVNRAEGGEFLYCELCDERDARRDAEKMEREYKAECDRLRAENAALKADAERYRWLRESESRPRTLPHVMQAPYVIRTGEERRPFIYDANGLNPELLDAAIDAALASHPEQP